MGTMYWIRVGMMILTFAVVVMAMRNLQSTKPTASPLAKLIMGTGDSEKFVLCPTRVTALETPAGLHVRETGMKWTRSAGGPEEELDPIAVEKWFGRNCSVSGKKSESGEGFTPVLKLSLVNGETKTLARAGSGEYLWNGIRFVSTALDQALRDLSEIPARAPNGQK